ncbi:MAG: hypothetical protein FJ265_17250 [Planctomycetes bacterium]|nr:hypothetical protein [Planctomycetota bacterium]
MTLKLSKVLLAAAAMLVLGASSVAQVTLKRGAIIFAGNASNTSAPAIIDDLRVRAATREWQKIQSEGIDPESAHGKQLVQQMNARIREAARAVAGDQSRDLVVRKDDIQDKQGKDVVDLTDQVVSKVSE